VIDANYFILKQKLKYLGSQNSLDFIFAVKISSKNFNFFMISHIFLINTRADLSLGQNMRRAPDI
jgi:hypothetical protein